MMQDKRSETKAGRTGGFYGMKKRITAMLLMGAMVISAAGTADAAQTKTATLNNAQVRFNGGAVQTLQCYNIDGYNYVRARDITNNLNMAVYSIENGEAGVMVDPWNSPTSKATPERLTQKTAQVQLVTGKLVHDGMPSDAACFLLNGRYYFKLADFKKAADYENETAIATTELDAKGGTAAKAFQEECRGIEVKWDAESRVIDVWQTATDLQGLFYRIRNGITDETEPSATETKTENTAYDTPSNLTESEYAEEVLRLVNIERKKAGVTPVQLDTKLTKAAQIRSEEIIEVYDHVRPNGEYFNDVLSEVGLNPYGYALGENIVEGPATLEIAMTSWMNSQGHRENILNPEFRYLGVGYTRTDGGYYHYWAQLFSS